MWRAIPTAIFAALALMNTAVARDWPTRPVTMVVPYAAGGPIDTIGRIMAARLSEVLGQQVIVENLAGAGGMTGANRVAKARPDGYTVLLASSAVLAENQSLYKKPLYNAATDFASVSLIADSARLLIPRKSFRANTLAEFIPYSNAHHAPMRYAPAGAGSGLGICAVFLMVAMG